MRLSTVNNGIYNLVHQEMELVKGAGYFYFAGAGMELVESASIYVPRLTDLTFEQWIDEARRLRREVEEI